MGYLPSPLSVLSEIKALIDTAPGWVIVGGAVSVTAIITGVVIRWIASPPAED